MKNSHFGHNAFTLFLQLEKASSTFFKLNKYGNNQKTAESKDIFLFLRKVKHRKINLLWAVHNADFRQASQVLNNQNLQLLKE